MIYRFLASCKNKMFFLIFLNCCLVSCAQTHSIGVDNSASNAEVALLNLSSNVNVVKVNGRNVHQFNNTWANAGDAIRLPPGRHTITFRYRADNYIGVVEVKDETTLGGSFVAGGHYEIKATFEGLNVYFELIQTAGPRIYGVEKAPETIIELMKLFRLDTTAYGMVSGMIGEMGKNKTVSRIPIDCAMDNLTLKVVQGYVVTAVEAGFSEQQALQYLEFAKTEVGQMDLKARLGQMTAKQVIDSFTPEQHTEFLAFHESFDLLGKQDVAVKKMKEMGAVLMEELALKCGWNLRSDM